jgi:hypothetical protein
MDRSFKRWIGFLNDLFYGRSYIAGPAVVNSLLDEKSVLYRSADPRLQSIFRRKAIKAHRGTARITDRLPVLNMHGSPKIAKFETCELIAVTFQLT